VLEETALLLKNSELEPALSGIRLGYVCIAFGETPYYEYGTIMNNMRAWDVSGNANCHRFGSDFYRWQRSGSEEKLKRLRRGGFGGFS
jgi:hypothetical protein